jgi:hypothetical protein
MDKYGKPIAPLLAFKKVFFSENELLLEREKNINNEYAIQPRRLQCKNCSSVLEGVDFVKQGVGYRFCGCCGHLNGIYEDTEYFCQKVYAQDGGDSYSRLYSTIDRTDYFSRVEVLYKPKADFLLEALGKHERDVSDLIFTDVGAGSGYFVAAMRSLGLEKVMGYDVSSVQVEFCNRMLGAQVLHTYDLEKTNSFLENIEGDVISLIGVLEHLRDPRGALRALRHNRRTRFLFISVPLVSPSVFFELAFPSIMSRHLSGVHTHLYSESSLSWMANEFGLKQLASWWFGSDLVDLYRSIAVRMKQIDPPNTLGARWEKLFLPILDELQLVLDKKHLASEVHILYKIER